VASHAIGYIGRINPAEKERIEESDDAANYRGTEYIGKLGIEQNYEAQLHGQTGVEQMETSAGGRAVRRLASASGDAGRRGGAVARHPLQQAGRGAVRRAPRRAGGPRPENRARCWPW
jgi:hypothetical protein